MTDLELAEQIYHSDRYAFVIVKNGHTLATGTREGISELLDIVAAQGNALNGATLADKIVGKAVAMVAAYAGITAIHTPLGSQAAAQVCADHHIAFHADVLVPLIQNKRSDGPCPMEKLTLPLSDPAQAVAALQTFVAQRRTVVPPVPA